MEKNLFEMALVPLLGLIGWVERSKVSRKEWDTVCRAKHDGLCDKLNAVHEDVHYIRTRLDRHIDGAP